MRCTLASCAAFLVAVAPAPVRAQPPGPVAPGDRVRVAAPSLGDGSTVGLVLAGNDDALHLALADGREIAVPRGEIRCLDVARGTRSRVAEGAAIGALSGAVILTGVLVAQRGVCDEDLGGCAAYGLVAAIGAGSGAVLGALVGAQSRTDHWVAVPVFQRASVQLGPTRAGGVTVRLSIYF